MLTFSIHIPPYTSRSLLFERIHMESFIYQNYVLQFFEDHYMSPSIWVEYQFVFDPNYIELSQTDVSYKKGDDIEMISIVKRPFCVFMYLQPTILYSQIQISTSFV